MPATYSYPGVYVEEIPSGVRPIAGVSTSDTAFVDVFSRGPVHQAVRITSLADFERQFGGLDKQSEASYAIQQYYLNGGQIAWVVRVNPGNSPTANMTLLSSSPPQGTLRVSAASPGGWGNRLRVGVFAPPGVTWFNLAVREVVTVNNREQVLNTETYRGLTMVRGDARYAVDVINGASSLIRVEDVGLGELPAGIPPTSSGGAPDAAFLSPYGGPLLGGNDAALYSDSGDLLDEAAFSAALVGNAAQKTGLYALDAIAPYIFNLLCLPAAAKLGGGNLTQVISAATQYCDDKRAFFLLDIPPGTQTPAAMSAWMAANDGLRDRNAAVYFPRLQIPDKLNENRLRDVGPSGTVAGVYGRTDAARGVWKAPAGTDAWVRNATLVTRATDLENGALNPLGINVLRNFPIYGNIVWGARTLDGADQRASEWKYIPVRRTALFIEESLYQGLKWVVFEPNDEPLWSQVRLNVGAFMHNLFRQGAFQGKTPAEAYFVKCDKDTTTQNDVDLGIVNIVVGFAPLKPAEFVVLKIQQMAGQVEA